jgi:hypothetical protein
MYIYIYNYINIYITPPPIVTLPIRRRLTRGIRGYKMITTFAGSQATAMEKKRELFSFSPIARVRSKSINVSLFGRGKTTITEGTMYI